ncbi:MAG: phosphoribosylanthranilate isomerase [Alphaproteobacteria bacterium]|nr:phosphoribosylanthranilate isomerase [Alphaproteobacteria bacterium]
MSRLIKICGVRSEEIGVEAASLGADLIGFVFFPKSPRYVAPEAAESIVTAVKRAADEEGFNPPHFVGLFVDAGEKALAEAAPFLSHFQFHGHEGPERCAAMSAEFGVEVIKALPVGAPGDLAAAADYAGAADMLLFDAPQPKNADRPGGNGVAFDWSALKDYAGETPFLVGGGLDAANVAQAIKAAGGSPAFAGVDVSSGVESAPGKKDAAAIAAFIKASRQAF